MAGDFIEEQLHAVAVDMRQNQRIESAIYRADHTVRIGVLVREHGLHHRTNGLFGPAVAGIADAAKPRLVLEH